MLENNKNNQVQRNIGWLDVLALILSFFVAIISCSGALVTYLAEAQIPQAPLWPLPGLVLVEWVLLGLSGLISAYLCLRRLSIIWLFTIWFLTGTFIPLMILGAFSIGAGVLITLLLFAVSAIIFTIRQDGKWLASFGLLMLGSISNLVLLLIVITLGNTNY